MFFEVAHYKLQHLFCWKQRLLDSSKKNTLAYKPHGCCHFSWFIPLYGPPCNYDTMLFENMHIVHGKEAYKGSGRRHETKLDDMIKGLQFNKLVTMLGKRIRKDDSDTEEEDDDIVTTKTNASIYNTSEAVLFEGGSMSKNVRELHLKDGCLEYVDPESNLEIAFLSPNTTLQLVWSAINRCTNKYVKRFCKHFEQNTGITKSPLSIILITF